MAVIVRSFHPATSFNEQPRKPEMVSSNPLELLAQLESWAQSPPTELLNDRKLRRELHLAARKLQLSLEEPASAVMRLTIAQASDSAVLKTAYDLGIFPYLGKDNRSKTISEIEANIKADPVLLLRILRYLTAQGSVVEKGNDKFALAPSCTLLGDQSFIEAGRESDEIVSQVFGALPSFLASINYQNPTDRRNGPANHAWSIPDADMYEVISSKFPEKMTAMGVFLGAFAKDSPKPHEIYPIKERLIDGFDRRMNEHLWVDIGGGLGHYTLATKQAHPSATGKFIVQEQEPMVNVAKAQGADQELNFMPYNYFDPQPIKGARAYYLRNIFHNLPDREAAQVLARIRDAMEPGYSRLLIHDLVVPQRGAEPWETVQDLLMMMGYSALERTRAEWEGLLGPAGLRVVEVYERPGTQQVIEVEIAG